MYTAKTLHTHSTLMMGDPDAVAIEAICDALEDLQDRDIDRLVEAIEDGSAWEPHDDEIGEEIWELDADSPSKPVVYTLYYRPSDNGYSLTSLCLDEEEEVVLCESYPSKKAALRGLAAQLLADARTSPEAMQTLRELHPLFTDGIT